MTILFRVDAGANVGLGHYYRSVSLAHKLSERGHSILFIHQPSGFWEKEKQEGFPFTAFEITDIYQDELEIIKKHQVDIFYVDGIIEYEKNIISEIKQFAKVVFYQNTSKSRYLADIFILPSIHQKDDFFEGFEPSAKIFQGLKFFTFNLDIASLDKKQTINEVEKIGIIAGGSDPRNTLGTIQKMLDYKGFDHITFTFYYGNDYMYLNELKNCKLEHANTTYSLFDHQEILENDLLISAFGVSTYEFMALGMPILSYGHQQANAEAVNYLAKSTEALISLGLIDDLNEAKLNSELNEVINNHDRRNSLSKLAKSSLDFTGVERVVRILEDEKR